MTIKCVFLIAMVTEHRGGYAFRSNVTSSQLGGSIGDVTRSAPRDEQVTSFLPQTSVVISRTYVTCLCVVN